MVYYKRINFTKTDLKGDGMALKSVTVFLMLFSAAHCFADGTSRSDGSKSDKSSANYKKAEQLLPGEEVVTPTGKKMRVWSTTGPVPVSAAPEPFEKGQKVNIDDVNVIVRSPGDIRTPGQRPSQPPQRDTFDLNPK